MLLSLPAAMPTLLRSPRTFALLGLGAVAAGSVAWFRAHREVPDPAELERERRDFLSHEGRIVDGSITEARLPENSPDDAPDALPTALLYRYRIAGVVYECGQDVSLFPDLVRNLRVDLPIQVRFDPRNPGDSIVVSEFWSGLRTDPELRPSPLLVSAAH